jgi:hypothetical protein
MDFTPVAAELLFGRPGLALAQHGKADTVGADCERHLWEAR